MLMYYITIISLCQGFYASFFEKVFWVYYFQLIISFLYFLSKIPRFIWHSDRVKSVESACGIW